MQGGWNDRKHTGVAVYTALSLLRKALKDGFDVVLDEPNCYGPEWSLFSVTAQRLKVKVRWQYVKATPQECKERCLAAGGSTAQCMEIDRKWEVYEKWLKQK